MKTPSHSPEFRTQALLKARTRGTRTLKSVAQEINLPLSTLKGWLQRSNKEGCGDTARPSESPWYRDTEELAKTFLFFEGLVVAAHEIAILLEAEHP